MSNDIREIAERARRDIEHVAKHSGSRVAAYDLIAKESGLSASFVAKFFQRAKDNPRLDTLDSLVEALRILKRRLAA